MSLRPGPPLGERRVPNPDDLPALVACDRERVLSYEEGALVSRPLGPGNEWRLPLDEPLGGCRVRSVDRDLSLPSVVLGNGSIYARLGHNRLLGWSE